LAGAWATFATKLSDLAFDPPDPNFSVIAEPNPPTPPTITPEEGIAEPMAAALNAMLTNQADGIGLASALDTTLNRAQGATAAGDLAARARQLEAARRYAQSLTTVLAQAASLRSEAADRVRESEIGDFSPSEIEALTLRSDIIKNGWPPSVQEMLDRYGLNAAQKKYALTQFTSRLDDISALTISAPEAIRSSAFAGDELTLIGILQVFAESPRRRRDYPQR
jgi:hypothetical protein